MTEFWICLISCIVARIYASLSGVKDGILYGRRGADSFSWNEHVVYVIERMAFGAMFLSGFAVGLIGSYWSVGMITISAVFGFSFWHNGYYYITRGRISGTYGYFSQNSTSSTAVIELRWHPRLMLEALSWICFLIYYWIIK